MEDQKICIFILTDVNKKKKIFLRKAASNFKGSVGFYNQKNRQEHLHFCFETSILESQTPEKHICLIKYLQNALDIDRVMQILIKLKHLDVAFVQYV